MKVHGPQSTRMPTIRGVGVPIISRLRDMYADENEKLKTAVVNVLTNGEGTCRHCGQGDIDMLCIDHVEDDGKQHRQVIPNRSV